MAINIRALLLAQFMRSGKDSIELAADKPLSPSKYVVTLSPGDLVSEKAVALTKPDLSVRRVSITDEEARKIARQLRKAEKKHSKAPERKAAVDAANALYRKQLLEDFSGEHPDMTAEEIQAVLVAKSPGSVSSR